MTLQKRIRFECFLIVGHAMVYLEYQCRPQAPFEIERYGFEDIHVFSDRVEQCLRSPAMMRELGGMDVEEAIAAIRSEILLLERDAPPTFDYRLGNVSFSGQTDTSPWRRFP